MASPSIQHLLVEHDWIRNALRVFHERAEDLASPATSNGSTRRELSRALDYFLEVVLLRHEEKEETLLLPELARAGAAWSDGPLADVRHDHRHGRYLGVSLRHALHQDEDWDTDDERHFFSVLTEWLELHHKHLDHEEAALFPLAERNLERSQDQTLLERFERVDIEVGRMPGSAELETQGAAFFTAQKLSAGSGSPKAS